MARTNVPVYNANTTYYVNDLVLVSTTIYRCKVSGAGLSTGDTSYWAPYVTTPADAIPTTDLDVAALTNLTLVAPGTPDYAVQALTQTLPFGFVSDDEGATVLAVIANLQARVTLLETALVTAGIGVVA